MASPETPIPTTETAPGNAGEASTVTAPQWEAMSNILNFIYEYRTDDGHDPSKVFARKVNKRVLPDYYDVIKEPMALSTIKAKVNAKEYKNFSQYVRDFALIPHNAQVYNRPDAGAYHDALEIKGLLEHEFKKLFDGGTISEDAAKLPYIGEIPAVDDVEATVEADEEAEEEDAEGSDEDEDEEDDEDDEEGGRRKKRRGPRSTAAITKREGKGDKDDAEARKRRGRPPRVDTPMESKIKAVLKGLRKSKNNKGELMISHFDRLPDKAALPDYYADIKQPMALDMVKKKLKRKKYNSLDHFMKDVELMFENAKQYNMDDSVIYKDAVHLQKEARKLVEEERSKPDTDYAMEDGRIPLPHILHNGELWKVGDWVHLQNANDLTKPIVAQLYRTWADAEGNKWVNACWYYRPEQTVHRFDRHFYENEVVKTGQYRDHPIDEVVDRCFVMFFTRYNKGRPRGFPPDKEIYVCESRYNEEKHKLNKIKTWASCLPDEVRDKDYEMDLFDVSKKMKKIPSPITYLLKDDAKETDDLPKPTWGAENAPPKIGAVHKRPRDPKDSPPPEPTPTPPPQPPPQPARQPSNMTYPNANQSNLPLQHMASTPAIQQAQARTSTPSHAPLQQRASYTPSHQTSYPQSASPAPFQPTQSGGFQPPPLTPHSSYNAGPTGATNAATTQFASYATPQTYQPRQVQPSYQSLQGQSNSQFNGPTGASASLAPTPIGGPNVGSRGYNAPQPPEVYSLSDVANASIPEDIRRQFHCDDQGRVLFFTAPPIEIDGPSSLSLDTADSKDDQRKIPKEPLQLGHSIRYIAAKAKRDAKIAEKRKRDAEEMARTASEVKRQKLAKEKHFQDQLHGALRKAAGLLENQLAASTKLAMSELANGQGLQKEMSRELDMLEARWRVQADKEKLAAQKRTVKEPEVEQRIAEVSN